MVYPVGASLRRNQMSDRSLFAVKWILSGTGYVLAKNAEEASTLLEHAIRGIQELYDSGGDTLDMTVLPVSEGHKVPQAWAAGVPLHRASDPEARTIDELLSAAVVKGQGEP